MENLKILRLYSLFIHAISLPSIYLVTRIFFQKYVQEIQDFLDVDV